MKKRALSLFMAFVFCFTALPPNIFAMPDSMSEMSGEAVGAVYETDAKEADSQLKEDNGTDEIVGLNSSESGEAVSLASASEPVEYIDKNGNSAVCSSYTLLTGDPEENKLDGTAGEAWYVISGQFNATQNWDVVGNVNIILEDGSDCSTNGYYLEVGRDASITIYGQEKGTGTLTIISNTDNVSALGGTDRLYDIGYLDEDGERKYLERGSLAVYGGNVNLESTKFCAASLKSLTVMGGTVTAKAVSTYKAIAIRKSKPATLAQNYKICNADDPQEKAYCGSAHGKKILITECTEHIWRYTSSDTEGMHKHACQLCSVFREEKHNFNIYGGESDENSHSLKCECGEKTDIRGIHDFEYFYNSDTLTHSRSCKVCGYGKSESAEEHDFTLNRSQCGKCGFKRGASVKLGDTLTNCETMIEAIGIAAGRQYRPETGGGFVTLYGDEKSFPDSTTMITVSWGTFTVDFNNAELSFPGKQLFDTKTNTDIDMTLKNGKIDLSGDTKYNDNPGIMVRSGKLTLDNFEITSSCRNIPKEDHIQHPAVKILGTGAFEANNFVLRGGLEIRQGAAVTPFTSGSFVCSCSDAAAYSPTILVGDNQTISDLIADGYALAEYGNETNLVFMYDYDSAGNPVNLTEIYEDVTVVPHPKHTFTDGYCACGYKCVHSDGFDANGVCQICGAHAAAKVGNEMFTEIGGAFERANELAKTGDNVTITAIYDLGGLNEEGYAAGKITFDINGHDIESTTLSAGKEDDDGNLIAEGDLTVIDSSADKSGKIGCARLLGGKLTVRDVNQINSIDVYSGEANIAGSKAVNLSIYGGKANISDGDIHMVEANGGETHISGGLVSRLKINNGKTYVTGGEITTFNTFTGGEIYISGGKFNSFSADIYDADDKNPGLEISGGMFESAEFAAKTKGRIAIGGGVFKKIIIGTTYNSNVRTVNDILADGCMLYSSDDNTLVSGNTDRIEQSVEAIRHNHSYSEKTGADGKPYGECECGKKAEAAIKNSGANTYYGTFEEAAANVADGNTIRLCTDAECEDDITVSNGVYHSPVTLNLNGKSLHFADGKKLILSGNLYFNIIDSDLGGGSISYLCQENGTVKLYGGTYGKIESVYDVSNLVPAGSGYGFKKTDGSGWVSNLSGLKELNGVTVKSAPFTASVIVTNDPDGTTTPDVVYLGQTVYFKVNFAVDANEPQIDRLNSMTCAIFYYMSDGDSRTVKSQYSVYGNSAVVSDVLSDTYPAGVYNACLRLDYLGCTLILNDVCQFNVAVCPHNSFTDGICNTCGLACKHPDVSDNGTCGTCGMKFTFQIIKANGAKMYYTDVESAFTAANLAENKGCTLQLFENVTYTGDMLLDGGEFTFDLNGYEFGNGMDVPYIYLTNVKLTVMTSVTRGQWTTLYASLMVSDGTYLTCRHDYDNSYLNIFNVGFLNTKTTGKITLGAGIYLSNLGKKTSQMANGDVLDDGCVFHLYYDDVIVPRNDTSTVISRAYVIKCPHGWEDNKCKYCGFVCNHENGYVNGICQDCGRACEHKNLDEKYYCSDCKQQMTVKTEKADGATAYGTDFTAAINAAENGTTVTVLADTELNQNVYVCGSGKTVTLDLNGHSVSSGGRVFGIGGTGIAAGESGKYGTLKLVGKGEIQTSLNVYTSGALDLGGWTDGKIKYMSVYQNAAVTGSIPSDAYIGVLSFNGFARSQMSEMHEITLDGGNYGEISWLNYVEVDMPLGILLAKGYAFQKEDNTFVPYNEILSHDSPMSIYGVSVVKCEEHSDANADGNCDYCNGELAASIGSKCYTNLQDAIEDLYSFGINDKITLLKDADGSYTVDKGNSKIILNGHSITGALTVADKGKVEIKEINGKEKVNNIIFSGSTARFITTTTGVIMGTITVEKGASWSSILPDSSDYTINGNRFGYKVYNADNTYKWYDRDTVGDATSINNVIMDQLPVRKEPILMINDQTMEDDSVIYAYQSLMFGAKAQYTYYATCTINYQMRGSNTVVHMSAKGNDDCYKSESGTSFPLSEAGTYDIWAEVTKEGYVRTSKKLTFSVKANLGDAVVELDQSEFTYTPLENGAAEYTPKIKSVKLHDQIVPESAYDISGDTKNSDAGDYSLTIKAKDGDTVYTGSTAAAWKILPCRLTKVNLCDYIKRYDGTTTVTADDIGNNHSYLPRFFYAGSRVDGIELEYKKDFNITNVDANFTSADVDTNTTVTCTVELINPNFVFEDENGNTSNTKTISQGMNIGRNVLPTDCEPDVGELVVRNNANSQYTFEVSKLLKTLPSPQEYCIERYSLTESDGYTSLISLDGRYYASGASIDENGILTLPVNAVDTDTEGSIGTLKVRVHTKNYIDFYVTLNVNAKNKTVPMVEIGSGATEITYGQALEDSEITGYAYEPADGNVPESERVHIDGTFTWTDGKSVPDAGDEYHEFVFRPTDADKYAEFRGTALVKVNKANISAEVITAPTAIQNLVYNVDDSTPQALLNAGSVTGDIGTMKYTLDNPESADAVWSEIPPAKRDAGEFTVYYRVFGDKNHLDSDYGTLKCSIAKYKLTYDIECLPKVYDGSADANIADVKSIAFYSATDVSKEISLAKGTDYTIESITYESANVGANLGAKRISATAKINLSTTSAARNYEVTGGSAFGYITPAQIKDIDTYSGYTYKVRYIDGYAKSVTATSFGAPDRVNYVIISDGVGWGNSEIIGTMAHDDGIITFKLAPNLGFGDVGKKYTEKVRIYTKDYNYCTGELLFTVEIADRDKPTASADDITVVYDGNAVPSGSISGTATVNGSKIDGTWSFKDNKSPKNVSDSGDYTVVFTPTYTDYYYDAETTVKVTVTPRDIDSLDLSLENSSFVYNKNPQKANVIAKFNGEPLSANADYTLEYSDDITNVGDKTVKITGAGNFAGSKELSYTIGSKNIDPTVNIEGNGEPFKYTGLPITPDVSVKDGADELALNADYTLEYKNNTNAGTASVTLIGKGNYSFEKTVYFDIAKISAQFTTVPSAKSGLVYNGTRQMLITAGATKDGILQYKLGENGTWSEDIPTATDAGSYKVYCKIVGDGNHEDTAEESLTVSIGQKDISNAVITLGDSLVYNGGEQTQSIKSVTVDGMSVTTYTVSDNVCKNAGEYTLKVTANGNFKGEREHKFTVARKSVAANVSVNGTYTYNGGAIEPTDIVAKDGNVIIPADEYTVSYSDNTNAGTATVTLSDRDIGNYIVSGTGTFVINKANITVRPKDVTKVYGKAPTFGLVSDSKLIGEEQLDEFAKTAEFASDGTAANAPVVAGGYKITARLTKFETDNLILSSEGTGTLTVTKAPLTVTAENVSREYGAENPGFSVTYSGFIDGEDESVLGGKLKLSYADSINAHTKVGTHSNATLAEGLTSGNYEISYVYGTLTVTKIPVNASAGTARKAYLTVIFDRSVEGLASTNFVVTDSSGNSVGVTDVTAAADNMSYTLSGRFEPGIVHTVTVVLSGSAADETHSMATASFTVTPVRLGSSVGGSSSSPSGKYTVTFDTNGGNKISSQTVTANSAIKEPTVPVKDGFDFDGWYQDKNLTAKYDFSNKITKSITLYAAWKEKDNSENEIILTIGKKEAIVFGEIKTNDVAPKIVNDRTMLPARFVAENLGAKVEWSGEKRLVTITGRNIKTDEETIILIYVDSDIAYVNGREIKLDSPAFISDDRTYTPVRFIAEELGANVEWVEGDRRVVISK